MKSWVLRLLLLHWVNLIFSHSLIYVTFAVSEFRFISHDHFVSSRFFSSPHTVSAGMKTTVSEAEHPLLCEGTRRVKGDLALALMITYKDDQNKLKKVPIAAF